ncbi:MAG: hypothetical protein KTQ13_11015 [Ferruginibacter sp.]|nr:hypothetical protein [Chitinophagaceae bacterium]MBP6287594.1 hypothetical protein [Ferruginibacter sp.]MBU9937175.1 hypothetical protein [Ferruginibacter sp.]
MKRILSIFAFFMIALQSNAQVKSFETAVAYNDFIVAEQTKVGETIKAFIDTYGSSKDSSVIQEARRKIVIQADSAVKQVKMLVPFKGDTSLKRNAINLFGFYYQIAAKEYDQLVQLGFDTKKSNEEISKEMTAIIQGITAREKLLDAYFQEAQKTFAAKYNIKLSENSFKID